MKHLLTLFLIVETLLSFGQQAQPGGILSLIPSPSMYYRASDSTVYNYKTSALKWHRILTSKDSATFSNGLNAKLSGIGTANYIPKYHSIGTILGNSLIYDNGSYVGIGTVSPLAKMHVEGSIYQHGDDIYWGMDLYSYPKTGFVKKSGYTGMFAHSNDTKFYIGMTNSTSVVPSDFTSITKQLSVDQNGYVGINTDAQAHQLEVVTTSAGTETTPVVAGNYDVTNGSAVTYGMVVYPGSSAITGNITNTRIGSGNYLTSIGVIGNTRGLNVSNTGFVGAGYTADPGSGNTLGVNGSAYINGSLTVRSAGYGAGKILTSDAYGLLSYATPTTGTVTSITGGLGLTGGAISISGTLAVDTANVSILSRQRAANTYQAKGAYLTDSEFASQGIMLRGATSGAYSILTDNSTNWNSSYTDRLKWDGGATGLTAATGRTSLGGTTVGQNLFTLTNPTAITFPRINADNTVSALDAATYRTAIGAGTSSATGTVTSITGGLGLMGGIISTTGTLAVDTANVSILSRQRAANAYQAKGTYNTGAGTLNYMPKYSATGSTLANSQIFDNGTFVGVGYTTDPDAATFISKLAVSGNIQSSGVADIWTGIYSPIHLGGSGTASSLTLQSTSGIGAAGSNIYFKVGSNGGTVPMTVFYNGLTAIGTGTASNAYLTIGGGATGGVAPLVIKSGTLLAGGSTVAGAIENDGTHLYYTPVAAGTRYQLDQQAGGGSGTVTSVSVTTANGVSGTVATATTTPAISLTLGDITPSKVNTLYVDARKAGSATGKNIWIGDGGRSSTGATSTQGSYNTVSGWSAGGLMSSSSFNSAFGYGSLANQTTGGTGGGGNTGFGASSLGYISTGYSNSAIGSNAGAGIVGNSTGNTTSINSVYVGYNTNAKVNGGDNEIVIGGATDGNGSNTATIGNASITNTYIRGLTYDYIEVTTTYTVLMTDHIVVCGGTTAFTITLPSAVTAGAGREFILKRTSTVAGTITIAPVSSQTIDGTAGNNTTLLGTNYNRVHLVSNGTNWLTL